MCLCVFFVTSFCSLIVFIRPASHSCLIGTESPDGSLSTWLDYVCTFVYSLHCLCLFPQTVCFCLALTTANSCERPADRCSWREFDHLSPFKHVCTVYCLLESVFSLSSEGVKLISHTGNPAAPWQIFDETDFSPGSNAQVEVCQIMVVKPLQQPSLTMILWLMCFRHLQYFFQSLCNKVKGLRRKPKESDQYFSCVNCRKTTQSLFDVKTEWKTLHSSIKPKMFTVVTFSSLTNYLSLVL